MTQINIVFWFLVIAGLAAVWLMMSCYFSDLGDKIKDLIQNSKENIHSEDDEEEET